VGSGNHSLGGLFGRWGRLWLRQWMGSLRLAPGLGNSQCPFRPDLLEKVRFVLKVAIVVPAVTFTVGYLLPWAFKGFRR
jgi:hypothetical protein